MVNTRFNTNAVEGEADISDANDQNEGKTVEKHLVANDICYRARPETSAEMAVRPGQASEAVVSAPEARMRSYNRPVPAGRQRQAMVSLAPL